MDASCENQSSNREYYLRRSKYFQRRENIVQRVYEQQVALEYIFTRGISAYGTVRVNNCSFHKRVFVKFTTDQWKTCSVINAYYSINYSDDNTDSFQFKLTAPKDKLLKLSSLSISSMTILFAICYCVNGQEFWDNNYSKDYSMELLESTYKETNSRLTQSSIIKTIQPDDTFYLQIAQDYQTTSNPSSQPGDICGLRNLGGTCYMNSILQSLSFTSLLTDYFLSNEYTKDINIKNLLIANEYFNLLYLLSSGEYSSLTPAPFKQIIGHVQHIYIGNQQQDAHEFLIFLLDYLHRDLNRTKTPEDNFTSQIHNDSIIVDLFYGIYQSITTCLECMYVSYSFEPFVCLTLPIPQTNQCTLADCLEQFNQDEFLMDDSRWFCPQCQRLCDAKKRVVIHKLPKVLIIQLKRFEMSLKLEWIKNETRVLCPEDNLDLQRCCFPSPQQSLYSLYSIINHNGSLNDGHYTTYCRTDRQQKWFECDDDKIKYLHPDEFYSNTKAYLLFYVIKQVPESGDI